MYKFIIVFLILATFLGCRRRKIDEVSEPADIRATLDVKPGVDDEPGDEPGDETGDETGDEITDDELENESPALPQLTPVTFTSPIKPIQIYGSEITIAWEGQNDIPGLKFESLVCENTVCKKCLNSNSTFVASTLNSRLIPLEEGSTVYFCVRSVFEEFEQGTKSTWAVSDEIVRLPTPKNITASNISELKFETPIGTTVATLGLDIEPQGDVSFEIVGDKQNFKINGRDLILDQSLAGISGNSVNVKILVNYDEFYSLERTLTFNVGVSELSPVGLALFENEFNENQSISSTFIVTDNIGDSHTFELVGTNNDNSYFSINGNALESNGLDYEAKNSYKVRVRVTDSTNLTYEGDLNISVRDLAELPTDISLQVLDGAKDGDFSANEALFEIQVVDQDPQNNYSFNLKYLGPLPGKKYLDHLNIMNFQNDTNRIVALDNWRTARMILEVEIVDQEIVNAQNTFTKTLVFEYEQIANLGLPGNCADILAAFPSNPQDGNYWVFHNKDSNKPWEIECVDLPIGQPKDYMNVIKKHTYSAYNTTQNRFGAVKIDPSTFIIDANDTRFAGSADLPFGVAIACENMTASARIKFNPSPLSIESEFKGGEVSYSADKGIIDLSVTAGGQCNFVSTNDRIKAGNKIYSTNGVEESAEMVPFLMQLKYDINSFPTWVLHSR